MGLLVQGIGLVLFSRIHSLWEFYLAYLIMSVGSGLGAFLPIMTTLNHWFYRRRATAVALAMEGMVIGGITLVPVLAWAIDPDEPDRFGWRTTASAIGVLTMLVAWPLSRLIRNRPEDYGQHPDGRRPAILTGGNPGVQGPEEVEPSYTWQEALKTRTFWFMNIGHACVSMVVHTVAVHLGILLDDRGFSLQTIGWIVSAYLAVGAVSTLVGGYVGDRLSMRVGIFVFAAMQTLGIFVLILFHGEPAAFLFAVLFGIDSVAGFADDCHPKRLLRSQGLCQYHRLISNTSERHVARSTSLRRIPVRHHRQVRYTLPDHRSSQPSGGYPLLDAGRTHTIGIPVATEGQRHGVNTINSLCAFVPLWLRHVQ